MFVDTHCHLTMLNLDPYDGDLDLAIQQAHEAGVSKMMGISVDLDDHIALSEIAARHASTAPVPHRRPRTRSDQQIPAYRATGRCPASRPASSSCSPYR